MRRALIGGTTALLLAACPEKDGSDGTTDETTRPEPAATVALSDGACPDLSASNIGTFSSGGHERRVAVILPETIPDGMPVVFSWHGLTTPEYKPVESFVDWFDMQAEADANGVAFLVPEALPYNLLGNSVLLWGILGNETADLTLYDDLRTCMIDELGADPRRISSWGFSGGALWTSKLIMERGDTLASAVIFSGGVEFEVPFLGEQLSYTAPAYDLPVLLGHGGDSDVWPDPSAVIIPFKETTKHLEEHLAEDGHTVWTCNHGLGHNLPNWFWNTNLDWLLAHEYGDPSPWDGGAGASDLPDKCKFTGE